MAFELVAGSGALAAILSDNSWFLLTVPLGVAASIPFFRGIGKATRKSRELLDSLYAPLGIDGVTTMGEDFSRGAILNSFTTTLKDGRRGEVSVVSNGDEEDPSLIFSEIAPGEFIEARSGLGFSGPKPAITA